MIEFEVIRKFVVELFQKLGIAGTIAVFLFGLVAIQHEEIKLKTKSRDRTVDVRRRSFHNLGKHFAGGRVDRVEFLRTFDPLAVYQQAAGRDFRLSG